MPHDDHPHTAYVFSHCLIERAFVFHTPRFCFVSNVMSQYTSTPLQANSPSGNQKAMMYCEQVRGHLSNDPTVFQRATQYILNLVLFQEGSTHLQWGLSQQVLPLIFVTGGFQGFLQEYRGQLIAKIVEPERKVCRRGFLTKYERLRSISTFFLNTDAWFFFSARGGLQTSATYFKEHGLCLRDQLFSFFKKMQQHHHPTSFFQEQLAQAFEGFLQDIGQTLEQNQAEKFTGNVTRVKSALRDII